jgi:hypothetical protein
MPDLDKAKRNVAKMVSMNAPEADIDAYISSEGLTIDQIKAHKVGAQPISQQPKPQSFFEQRLPYLAEAGRNLSGGAPRAPRNPLAAGANIVNQAAQEALRPFAVADQFLRTNETINPPAFPAGRAASNILGAIPRAIAGEGNYIPGVGTIPSLWDMGKAGFNAILPEAPQTRETEEISRAFDVMGRNVAMVAAPQVGAKVKRTFRPFVADKIGRVSRLAETKAITPPFDKKKGLETFDRPVKTATEGNYAPSRKGIEKLQNEKKILRNQSKSISQRSAKQGNTIDFKETNKIFEEELAKADKSSAFYEETKAAVADAKSRLDRIANKYPDGQVPIDVANELKSSFQDLATGKYDQAVAPSQIHIDMYKKTGHQLLSQIVQQEPALRKIGLKERDLIELEPILGRKIATQENAQVINWQNLRKLGLAGAVGAATNPAAGVAMFLGEGAVTNPKALHVQAVALDRLKTSIYNKPYKEINIKNFPVNPEFYAEANRLNVRIDNLQEVKNGKAMPLFTDRKTGTTFTVTAQDKTLTNAVARVRKAHSVKKMTWQEALAEQQKNKK